MKFSIDLEPPFGLSAYWYAVGIGVFLLSFLLRFVVNKLFEVRVYSPFRLDRLHRELGDDYVILFRAHYLVANSFDFARYDRRA